MPSQLDVLPIGAWQAEHSHQTLALGVERSPEISKPTESILGRPHMSLCTPPMGDPNDRDVSQDFLFCSYKFLPTDLKKEPILVFFYLPCHCNEVWPVRNYSPLLPRFADRSG